MDDFQEENGWIFKKELKVIGSFLENFVSSQQFPATVKDIKTGQYILGNQAVALLSGLKPEDYIGLTAQDIGYINHLKESTIKNILTIDAHVAMQKINFARFKQAFFTKKKLIIIEEVTKKPVFDAKGHVVAILGYSANATLNTDLVYLFSLYQQYLPIREAIFYFIQHMKLNSFFHTLPTKQELIILLAMRKSSNAKAVARELHISPRTVHEHKAHLRDKLTVFNLDELLMHLRIRHEHPNLVDGFSELV